MGSFIPRRGRHPCGAAPSGRPSCPDGVLPQLGPHCPEISSDRRERVRIMAKRSPYRQAYGSGECGLCAIIAAVDTVCHNIDEEAAGQFLSTLAQALPAETAADLARILYEEGTERPEMERMLAAAQAWTRARRWCAWNWEGAHPQR